MRIQDLDPAHLVELNVDRSEIRLAGDRAVLVNAVAMGFLRKYLFDNLGEVGARTVLTQFGFAQGWRLAEAMTAQFEPGSEHEWIQAGMQMFAAQGLFLVAPGRGSPLGEEGVMLDGSYEAEQHLLHFGQHDAAVCTTICGLFSGFVSRVLGREIYVLEDRCVGKGDAGCHLIGRTRAEWGDERAVELQAFERRRLCESLDVSLERLVDALQVVESKLRTHRRKAATRTSREEPDGLVARSRPMQVLVDLARRVAGVDATVLITGETGSGKERIARFVHEQSTRALGPFIAVNCGAMPETLLESELFGHAKGAFTGASRNRPGLFEAAHHGTLFLDEIGEVSPAMQVKLLRVLQEREVRRVGENKSRAIDVRILAATNRDLDARVSGGHFRQDLYYRLKVVELHVPALRQREDDILPLARILLVSASERMNRPMTGIEPDAAFQLLHHAWPGNVRELENAIERAVALARGHRVELEDLPEEVRQRLVTPGPKPGQVRSLEQVEKEYILAALDMNDGNRARTADQLEIGSATLYRRLKKYRRDDSNHEGEEP